MSNQPSKSQVHVNAPLTNVSVAYDQEDKNFIADQFFGSVPVEKDSDVYYVFDQHDWMRDDAQMRGPGSPPEYSGFNASTATYTCKRFDLAKKIPADIRDNADFDMDRVTTRWLTRQLKIRRERYFSTNYFATGKWGSNETTPTTLWDVVGSTPITDVDAAKRAILAGSGQEANRMIVGYDVHVALKNHADIIERVKYVAGNSFNLAVAPKKAAAAVLAELFEVDLYLVAKAVYSASAEGAATPTYDFIQGKHCLLGYCEPEPNIMSPSAGYIFRSKTFGHNDQGLRVKKWWSEEYESDVIENAFKEDMKQVSAACGYILTGCAS